MTVIAMILLCVRQNNIIEEALTSSSLSPGRPCMTVDKGSQDAHAIFDGEDDVEEPIESTPSEILADCNSASYVPPPPTAEDFLADIQNLFMQSLQLAGDDLSLLQHIKRSSVQMLTSLQMYKACQSSMPSHPTEGLTRVEDGFGMSLIRAKPFIETCMQKKRKEKTSRKEATEGVEVESFPLLPRRKRVTLQGGLDKQAYEEDSD